MERDFWLTYASWSSLAHPVLHFFPSSDFVSAPYPINLSITVFGGTETRSLVLEGGRLGSPDGVRLEEAFPELKAKGASAVFGFEIELSSPQRRLDLAGSCMFVELVQQHSSVRYEPIFLIEGGPLQKPSLAPGPAAWAQPPALGRGIAIADKFFSSSLVLLNGTKSDCVASAAGCDWQLPALSVIEAEIPQSVYEKGLVQSCSWGEVRSCGIELTWRPKEEGQRIGTAIGAYMVYRDAETKRVTSVVPL